MSFHSYACGRVYRYVHMCVDIHVCIHGCTCMPNSILIDKPLRYVLKGTSQGRLYLRPVSSPPTHWQSCNWVSELLFVTKVSLDVLWEAMLLVYKLKGAKYSSATSINISSEVIKRGVREAGGCQAFSIQKLSLELSDSPWVEMGREESRNPHYCGTDEINLDEILGAWVGTFEGRACTTLIPALCYNLHGLNLCLQRWETDFPLWERSWWDQQKGKTPRHNL